MPMNEIRDTVLHPLIVRQQEEDLSHERRNALASTGLRYVGVSLQAVEQPA
jgi:hypothetical protein